MNSTLPPCPYKLLGVSKDATLPEIRSAHRKLVLKCHPDKVQDAALKAIKVDEFQKVQEAYELLSDETKRLQYDEQVKLFELRKEMSRGNPTPRSNPFEYEVKTAEPRPNSYTRAQPSPKVYSYPSPQTKSHEEVRTREDDPSRHMRKPSSFEERDRKRTSVREEELRREAFMRKHAEEERIREKELRRSAHGEKKKSREKERKRGSDEKYSRTRGAYVEDDSSDEYSRTPPRASEKKSSRHASKMEEHIRASEEAARAAEAHRVPPIKEAPLDPKWSDHMDFAGAYMQAARRKVAVEDAPSHPGMHRAATFAAPATTPYNVRYAAPIVPVYSDEDLPRRSSGRRETRRSSETPRKKSRERERKSSPSHARAAYVDIVEPPSPPATSRKPTLQSHTSSPPILDRGKPSRSRTTDNYTRHEPIPNLPRAHTFSGEKSRERSSTKLRQELSSDSESDTPAYPSPRVSHSPPQHHAPEPTRYIVREGRANPVPPTMPRHRSDLHNLNDYPRERSESPRGTPARHPSDRPPLSRNPPSSERPRATSRSHPTTTYYTPGPEEPIVHTARPKPTREGSRGPKYGAPFEGKVSYTPNYGPEQVIYATHPAANLYSGRRGSDREREYYTPHQRGGGREPVYA